MQVMLGIIACLIFLLYSIYFISIIKGTTRGFELEILRSLADWIIVKGVSARRYIWVMFWTSLLGEITYIYLSLAYIPNPVMRILTALVILMEIYHFIRIAIGLKRFFSGKYLLSQIFDWRLERASAIVLFTHSFLVLMILSFF
ncbi:MAG: hypothetical protein VB084_05265 [Syntrophomonadaceae bacterium]|nr:hypothetical protein [Syntrophomonadaceae bacterium]